MSLFLIFTILVVIFVLLFLFKGSATLKIPENLTDEDIKNIYRNGQKIQAIKYYRVLHKVGLREAKEAVEKMMI